MASRQKIHKLDREKLGKKLKAHPDRVQELVEKYAAYLAQDKKSKAHAELNLFYNLKAIIEAEERGIAEKDIPKALLLWNRIRRYGDFNIHAFGSLLIELNDYLKNVEDKENTEPTDSLLFEHINLRATPEILEIQAVKEMIQKRGIYNKLFNDAGEGIIHLYRSFRLAGAKIVMDYSTGLMWQHSGSTVVCTLKAAKIYVDRLNKDRFAGFDNWRLPTCDELACLTENHQNEFDLYIDSSFDFNQWHIWTSDLMSTSPRAWVVYFNDATVRTSINKKSFVRAVRNALMEP